MNDLATYIGERHLADLAHTPRNPRPPRPSNRRPSRLLAWLIAWLIARLRRGRPKAAAAR